LGSSLPPAELAQRDLGIFEELKHLFSIALKVRRSGEVTEQVYAKKHATDVAVQRLSPNPSGAVRDYVKRAIDAACVGVGHWLGCLSPNPNYEVKAHCTRRVDAHAIDA
jgi:hypothetical protein